MNTDQNEVAEQATWKQDLGVEDNKYKGPEARRGLVCLEKSKEASVLGKE